MEEGSKRMTNFEIPPDLERMLPHEMNDWLASVEEDESVTDAEVQEARKAVSVALGVSE